MTDADGAPSLRRHFQDGGLKRVDIKGAYNDRGEIVGAVSTLKAAIECRLDWYHDRMLIIDRQHEAGIRIRHLFRRAILPASTTGSYGPAVSGGGDSADTADARHKLFSALRGAGLATSSSAGPAEFRILTIDGEQRFPEKFPVRLLDLGHIVMAVCGLDEWAGGAGRLSALRVGLTNLADWWQLER